MGAQPAAQPSQCLAVYWYRYVKHFGPSSPSALRCESHEAWLVSEGCCDHSSIEGLHPGLTFVKLGKKCSGTVYEIHRYFGAAERMLLCTMNMTLLSRF